MATPIEIIIDGHSKRFSSSDLGNSKIIASVGETVTILSLCPDPIDMNSVSMNSQSALDETKLAQNTF